MTAAEASVSAAHVLLQSARDALEEAVKALPGIEGYKTMATPGLVELLVRVSTAKSHLNGLELVLAAEVAAVDIRNARRQ